MISSSLTKQLQELNLPEDVVAKVLLLMDDAYDEGYDNGYDNGYNVGYNMGWRELPLLQSLILHSKLTFHYEFQRFPQIWA